MAIARCVGHQPVGRSRTYVRSVEPSGFPDSGLVCGRKDCDQTGLIWLEESEADNYDQGVGVFEAFSGSAMKMRAK